jgi:hypothetical protein
MGADRERGESAMMEHEQNLNCLSSSSEEGHWQSTATPSYWGKVTGENTTGFNPYYISELVALPTQPFVPYTPQIQGGSLQLTEQQFEQLLDMLVKKIAPVLVDILLASDQLKEALTNPARAGRRIERV